MQGFSTRTFSFHHFSLSQAVKWQCREQEYKWQQRPASAENCTGPLEQEL